jgi:hypothetical protein
MHYLLKLIVPGDVEVTDELITNIMNPFDETAPHITSHSFFDWYEIGGRWDNYSGNGNIYPVSLVGADDTAHRVIIAYKGEDAGWYAHTMLVTRVFNGLDFQETMWKNGSIKKAIRIHNKKVSRYKKGSQNRYKVNDSWRVVIIDYHC